jgi:hypothetical protein
MDNITYVSNIFQNTIFQWHTSMIFWIILFVIFIVGIAYAIASSRNHGITINDREIMPNDVKKELDELIEKDKVK